MDRINKLILPATILLASIVLGGFFYASQVNEQKFIETQQKAKAEQEKKEYVAKRKKECYSLYEKEREKWNNVADFIYNETRDVCIVKYKSDEPAKSEQECGKLIKDIYSYDLPQSMIDRAYDRYDDCLENWFSKEF